MRSLTVLYLSQGLKIYRRILPGAYPPYTGNVSGSDHSQERYGKSLAGSLLGKQGIHVIAVEQDPIGLGLTKDRYYVRSGGWHHHLFGGMKGSGSGSDVS